MSQPSPSTSIVWPNSCKHFFLITKSIAPLPKRPECTLKPISIGLEKRAKISIKRVFSFQRNPAMTHLCEKTRQWKKEREQTMEELNPVLTLILILICGQCQRPGYTPEAIKAQRCWSAWAAKAVITLWGSDLGKWEATTLVATTISYQSSIQTSIGYLQALGRELSYSHCTEHSCLYLAVEIYCN